MHHSQADLALSERSHLEEDVKHGGLVVNSELQAATDLWVAGDSASIYSHSLGRYEHHTYQPLHSLRLRRRHRASGDDHCRISGELAANNMIGTEVSKQH